MPKSHQFWHFFILKFDRQNENLPINIFPTADFYNLNYQLFYSNLIEYSVIPLSNPINLIITLQFFTPFWVRVFLKLIYPRYNFISFFLW
jgi:hypothetical protein